MNVSGNIRAYKDAKKEGLYVPSEISLKVMEERHRELVKEYNRRHKGEMRGDGSIIKEDD